MKAWIVDAYIESDGLCLTSESSEYILIFMVMITVTEPEISGEPVLDLPDWARDDRKNAIIIYRQKHHRSYRRRSRGIYVNANKLC